MTNRILGLEPYSDSVSYVAAQEWLRLKSVFFFCGIAPVLQVVTRAHCVSSDDLKPLDINQAVKWPDFNAELNCDDQTPSRPARSGPRHAAHKLTDTVAFPPKARREDGRLRHQVIHPSDRSLLRDAFRLLDQARQICHR
ncbi:hypothetical protein PGTUg99_006105 [Puccinia graminis f. sp. tritici]|uniref:Uncharacterized protein n=1 Tax=Puccinia graminis f. sp. tritici TaxID=56615 RepID=A0A5B0NRC2_PUCGR|nr:hypothetical protein PGTUg99_006105 [Puccinia graminis f. sp. tritici]